MKPILKKTIGLIIIIIVMNCLITGCKNDRPLQDKNNSEKTEKVHEELTISSFNNLITEDFISAFHKKYPEVNLKVISYAGVNGSGYALYSLKNGDIPDIYISSQNFDKDAQQKYLLDLSNYEFINNSLRVGSDNGYMPSENGVVSGKVSGGKTFKYLLYGMLGCVVNLI